MPVRIRDIRQYLHRMYRFHMQLPGICDLQCDVQLLGQTKNHSHVPSIHWHRVILTKYFIIAREAVDGNMDIL